MADITDLISAEAKAEIDLGDGLKLVDGVVKKGLLAAKPDDVPLRYDLPKDHPLYGTRALRNVASGWPDSTVDADGHAVPATAELEPVEPEPIGDIERDR